MTCAICRTEALVVMPPLTPRDLPRYTLGEGAEGVTIDPTRSAAVSAPVAWVCPWCAAALHHGWQEVRARIERDSLAT